MDESLPKKRRANYGWVILALTFGNIFVEGGVKNSHSVLLPALKQGFGGSTALTAGIFSASGIVGAFSAPILGKLLDMFGAKYMFLVAGIVILAGWWASSMVNHIWQLFIFYSLVATVGQTMIGFFTGTAVLTPWFPQTKGLMLGIADAGNPTGQAVITPFAQYTVSKYGWRSGFQALGIIFFLIVSPLNFLGQRKPPGYGNSSGSPKHGDSEESHRAGSEVYTSLEHDPIPAHNNQEHFNALSEASVWLLLFSRATQALSNQMTSLHIIAFFVSAGYGEMQSASAIGVAGLFGVGARPCFGILSDKFGRETVYSLRILMTVLSLVIIILFAKNAALWPLLIFVGLTGLSDGSGLLIGVKAADIYPSHVLGSVMGVIEVGRGIGLAAGGVLTGLMFDLYGNYTAAYWLAAFLLLMSIGSMWALKLITPMYTQRNLKND
tara:strand:+ start:672 stop:1985 length:1314 start_codon:yes stop_codon:yes gene_type:complete